MHDASWQPSTYRRHGKPTPEESLEVSDGEGVPVLDVESVVGLFWDGVLVSEVAGSPCRGTAEHACPHRDMMRQRRKVCKRATPGARFSRHAPSRAVPCVGVAVPYATLRAGRHGGRSVFRGVERSLPWVWCQSCCGRFDGESAGSAGILRFGTLAYRWDARR
jgi:hypothetical protein